MSLFLERYKKLNDRQKEVVDTIEGPVLVVAGPGSGKTEVLSLRVAHILKNTDTHPSNILCLTFTDFAALNMRRRLAELIGRDAYRVPIYTFHSFSVDVINRYPEYFYDGASFLPADDLTQTEVLEGVIHKLSHDNPLKKVHPEQGFTYLKAIKDGIKQLKRAGLNPEDFQAILKNNEEALAEIDKGMSVFDERVSMKLLPKIKEFAERVVAQKPSLPVGVYQSLSQAVGRSLNDAILRTEEEGKTASLSAWKEAWTKKNDEGRRVLKDAMYLEKMKALAEVYEQYLNRMHERGYFDFDDMLLDVLQALKKNDALRYELQERFQYLLVDEFQDTNDAQMQLLHYLTDLEVHEGRPNIMAVGDDDQAIFKFQGAEISNILAFGKKYREPKIITLTHNYRSRQDILDLARYVIQKGGDRLENRIEGLRKDLVAAGEGLEVGAITNKSFSSSPHQYHWIAQEVRRIIDKGVPADQIAIIARQHKDLEALLPFFSATKIPVAYERQRNVLLEPHVRQIIQMGRFLEALGSSDPRTADVYLSEIMSYPFWGIDRLTLWNLSSGAAKEHALWLDGMVRHSDPKIQAIAEFFLALRNRAKYEPVESIIDSLVGSHLSLLTESEDEDEVLPVTEDGKFTSPFRNYYFSPEKLQTRKAEYLSFLSSLRVFVQSLREYKQGQFLKMSDLVEFIDIHEKNNLPITDQSPFVASTDAVHLLTAHKAKGLEFEVVFVVNCQDEIWARAPFASLLPFPSNLPIVPAGDTLDDQLRLFYVALTRAKKWLYLTAYERTESGKESMPLRFLTSAEDEHLSESLQSALLVSSEEKGAIADPVEILSVDWSTYNRGPYVPDESALLSELVKDYQMSVTHLNNFLNVRDGGPMKFLEQNLLRFPQAKTVSGSFGSAVHGAVEDFYAEFKNQNLLPPVERLLELYNYRIERQRLSERDLKGCLSRGEKALTTFYKEKQTEFRVDDRIEMDFRHQGVVLGEAHINGKIDRIVTKGPNELIVRDLKTGHPVEEWESSDAYEKVKLHNYRRQLVFYKLLVEHSRDFGGKYTVSEGVLDFVEPLKGRIIELPLVIEQSEVDRLTALIQIVFKKVKNLEFPEVEKYSKDLKGVLAFEEDLLDAREGRVS